MQVTAFSCEAIRGFGGDIFGIEAVAGAGFVFKLRPELGKLHSLGDAAPESLQAYAEGRVLHGGRWRSGRHRRVIIKEAARGISELLLQNWFAEIGLSELVCENSDSCSSRLVAGHCCTVAEPRGSARWMAYFSRRCDMSCETRLP